MRKKNITKKSVSWLRQQNTRDVNVLLIVKIRVFLKNLPKNDDGVYICRDFLP